MKMVNFQKVKLSGAALIATGLIALVGNTAQAQNLVVNGDFSAGNTGFVSSHAFAPPTAPDYLNPQDVYSLTMNPQSTDNTPTGIDMHTFVSPSFVDHTQDVPGLMMVVNSDNDPTSFSAFWQQTIAVDPGATYDFSAYFAYWGLPNENTTTLLRFAVVTAGTNVNNAGALATYLGTSGSFNPPAPTTNTVVPAVSVPGVWGLQSFFWTNTTNVASVEIRLENVNPISNSSYDHAVDDISFTTLSVVPEASSLTYLALGGLGVLGMVGRRMVRKAK